MEQFEAAEKAVKQLVASAIKHSASEVSFSLSGEKTLLRFLLSDSRASELELSVSPFAVAAALLERVRFFVAQVPSRVKNGILRTEFSSMVSDCEAQFYLNGPNGTLSRIVLSNFLADAPDKIGFWLGFDDSLLKRLHSSLSKPNGLYLVWSESNAARTQALAALKSAYAGSESIPVVEALTDDLPFLAKAKNTRIFVGISGRDPLTLIRTLLLFRPEARSALRGVIFQSQVEQNCISCKQPIGRAHNRDLRELLESEEPIEVWRGKGCNLCAGKGTAGHFSVSSLITFEGRVGQLFIEDAPFQAFMDELSLSGFYLPYEYGLRALKLGECSEEALLKGLTPLPKGYKARVPRGEICSLGQGDSTIESGRFILSDEFFISDGDQATPDSEEKPITGAAVYYPKPRAELKREQQQPPVAEEAHSSPRPGGTKILVIDDDPDQRAILGKVFEMAGYQVSSAADGIDGIVSAVQNLPELILVDLMMPDVDGRETIRRLRENPSTKEIPIVALTAYPDSEVEYDLLDAGANDFCPKSVSKKVLLKRVEKLKGY